MSFRPDPRARSGTEDVKVDHQQQNDASSMRATNWAGGAFEAGKNATPE